MRIAGSTSSFSAHGTVSFNDEFFHVSLEGVVGTVVSKVQETRVCVEQKTW